MFQEDGGRPNDQRGFIHKSFIGRAIGGVAQRVIGGTPFGAVAGTAISLFKPPARRTVPRAQTARPTLSGQRGKELGRELKLGDAMQFRPRGFAPEETACIAPAVRDRRTGRCRTPAPGFIAGVERLVPGGAEGFLPEASARAPVGDAVMGQFGAALEPGTMTIERSVCLPGMQLAKDGLCYNKGAITNSQRMWPRGRRPLLTGGDMRAIGIAARAGAKLDRTTKRLRALGMMKKLPAPRKAAPHAHAKPVAAVSV